MSNDSYGENKYDLSGCKVAVLATDGFEQSELMEPVAALRGTGASVSIVSLPDSADSIRGWNDGNWGDSVSVDDTVDSVSADDFQALVLPGGVINPDKLRANEDAVEFVRSFLEDGKPVAAICHGPWMLAEADVLKGRTITSYHSIKTDLVNAGANWVDESVVVDHGLVTSRNPDDMADFIDKMLEEIEEGVHAGQHA